MLAEARRGGHDPGGIVLEAVRDADTLHLAEDLVFPLDKVLALGVLRIVFNVAGLIRALVGDADLVEDLLELGTGVLRAEIRECLVRLLTHGGVEREAGDALRQARRDARRADADDGIALLNRSWTVDGDKQLLVVLRGVEREAGREIRVVAGAVRHRLAVFRVALVVPEHRIVIQQTEHGVVLRNVAGLALAGLERVDVGRQCGHAGVVGRDIVRQVRVDLQRRRRRGDAVHVHIAAHGLTGDVVGRLGLVRTRLAVAGDVHDAQLAVDAPADLIGEAHLGIGAGLAGLDPDVGPLEALLEDLLAGGRARVAGDGELIAVVLRPARGAARAAGDLGGLGLEHLRAHLRHQAAGEGAGDRRAGHKDLDAVQNAEIGIFIKLLCEVAVNFFETHVCCASFLLRFSTDFSEFKISCQHGYKPMLTAYRLFALRFTFSEDTPGRCAWPDAPDPRRSATQRSS